VGILVLVIGIAISVTGGRRSSTTLENVKNTPTGQERVEEQRDWARRNRGRLLVQATRDTVAWHEGQGSVSCVEGGNMLAAGGGLGIVGILVVVLVVLAIVYFVRRS
jgi:hypothetical protein